jgi:hypothetical protein
MAIVPVVRYMLVCDDWRFDALNSRRITVIGLLSNIHSVDDPPYPLLYRELCVLLILTGGRGEGDGHIVCVVEETGQKVFETRKRRVKFGPDPLDVTGVPFRIRDCPFPFAGLYSIQFWYDGSMVDERPLRLR